MRLTPGIASILIMALILVVSHGCGKPPEPEPAISNDPVFGGVYKRAFTDTFIVLDPAEVKDSFSHEVCRQIYDGLVEFDSEGNVIPSLAGEWKISEDRTEYVFKLHSNVRFHAVTGSESRPTLNGGRLLTADDVEYSFKRLMDPAQSERRWKVFSMIKGFSEYREGKSPTLSGIKVLASDTISFTLEKPFAPFLSLLAMSNALIVPKEDAENLEISLASEPVGTGPFIWAGRKGETMVLKANKDHFRGMPYLDAIEYPVIPESMSRFREFLAGNLMQVEVPDQEYKNIKQDPKWGPLFQETSRWGTYYLGFNVTIPPFDNIKVRQAINWAVDRDSIVKLILNDRARVAKGVLPPGITGYNPSLRGYTYDLARAKKVLAEAGYPDGKGFPEITLQFNSDQMHTRTSELILANLRDAGIKCNTREVDFQEHLDSIEKGTAGFFRMGWTVDYPDPDNFLHTLFHSSNMGSGGNFSRYSNRMVDDLLERARFEITPKERIPLYQQAEQLIVDEAPWVFVYHYTTHLLAQPQVRGLKMTPLGAPFIRYRELWLQHDAQRN